MRAWIDSHLSHFISKKLSVFLVASLYLWLGHIDGQQWAIIAGVYIGGQSAIDAINNRRKNV